MGGPTANTTDVTSENVHGTNPQRIVEKILRTKVYATQYWKESCFGLTAETLVDRAIELSHVGGTYGGTRKPTKFMCLLLKMLQIQPDLEIVVEFVTNSTTISRSGCICNILSNKHMNFVGFRVPPYVPPT